MVRLTGNMATNAGVAICGGTAIYFPTSVNATETTAAGCGTADTTNSSGVFQCLTLAANTYDIRVNCGSAFRWDRYADEIQHATFQTGDGCACGLQGNMYFGIGNDFGIRWSTADTSNHAVVLGIGDTSQQIHITDLGAIATDWARCAGTHPELAIHSNTTPATDYLAIGNHDGTTATVDVVGGTTLAVAIAGNTEATFTASGLNLPANSDLLFTGTTGTNDINLVDSVADALSIVRGSTDMVVFDSSTPRVTITPATTITGLITSTGGLTLPANADIAMTGTTGTNDIVLTNGIADALSITDGSADIVVVDTSTAGNIITFESGAIFNEGSADVDFRVEGANNANLLTLDGGTDSIGIGSAVVAGALIDIEPGAQDRDMVTAVGMAINLEADSTQINAAGNCATIAVGAAIHLGAQTYTSTATGLTVTDLSTLHVVGEPTDSTNVTGTRKYSALIETGSLGLGIPGGCGATLKFGGSDSGIVTIQVAAAAGTYSLTLPTDDGTACQFLQTNGSGVLGWATAGSAAVTALNNATENELVTVGSTTTELDAEANLTYNGTTLIGTTSGQSAVNLRLINTHASGSPGVVELYHNSSSPADGDNAGQIEWNANDSGGTERAIVRMAAIQDDVTSTTQDSRIDFGVQNNVNAGGFNTTASLSTLGVWTDSSAEAAKTYEGDSLSVWGGVAGRVITDKIKALNAGRYHSAFVSPTKEIKERHLGPSAEQFYDLFGTGIDPRAVMLNQDGMDTNTPGLAAKDLAGAAILGIQELIARVEALEALP